MVSTRPERSRVESSERTPTLPGLSIPQVIHTFSEGGSFNPADLPAGKAPEAMQEMKGATAETLPTNSWLGLFLLSWPMTNFELHCRQHRDAPSS